MDSHVYAQLTAALATEATLSVADDFYRGRGGGGPGGRGPRGYPGNNGPPGPQGPQGPAGADGADTVALQVADGHIQVSYDDSNSWSNLISIAELTGSQGPQGDPGTQGEQGPPGADGSPGANGLSAFEIAQQTSNNAYADEASWLASLVGATGSGSGGSANSLISPDTSKEVTLDNAGVITLPAGGTIQDSTANEGSVTITPPNAVAGQGLVIRPTVGTSLTNDVPFSAGATIVITLTDAGTHISEDRTDIGGKDANWAFTITGISTGNLGSALTGTFLAEDFREYDQMLSV